MDIQSDNLKRLKGIIDKKKMKVKDYKIYLFKSQRCIGGWLSYIKPGVDVNRATLSVKVSAESGPKAKNKAVTLANNGFHGLEILSKNYGDEIWGLNKFPELKEEVDRL